MVKPNPHASIMKSCKIVFLDCGFVVINVDPCMFMSKTIICVLYWPSSYASVIGTILYLVSNTRPYFSFDFHQCAQFTHNTKASNETSVKRICWYLQGTNEKNLVFDPSKKLVVRFYDNADFAGLWGH